MKKYLSIQTIVSKRRPLISDQSKAAHHFHRECFFSQKKQLPHNLFLSQENAYRHISSVALPKRGSCVTADGAFMSLLAK